MLPRLNWVPLRVDQPSKCNAWIVNKLKFLKPKRYFSPTHEWCAATGSTVTLCRRDRGSPLYTIRQNKMNPVAVVHAIMSVCLRSFHFLQCLAQVCEKWTEEEAQMVEQLLKGATYKCGSMCAEKKLTDTIVDCVWQRCVVAIVLSLSPSDLSAPPLRLYRTTSSFATTSAIAQQAIRPCSRSWHLTRHGSRSSPCEPSPLPGRACEWMEDICR